MASVPRCLALLEKLQQPPAKDNSKLEAYFIETNNLCGKHIQISLDEIYKENIQCPMRISVPNIDSAVDPQWTFSNYLQYIILNIVRPLVKEPKSSITEQLSPHQLKLVLLWINVSTDLFLLPNIDSQLLNNQVIQNLLKELSPAANVLTKEESHRFLISSVNYLTEVFQVKEIIEDSHMSMTALKYLAGVHSIKFQDKTNVPTIVLDALFEKIPEQYFRYLLMLKSTTALKTSFNDQMHYDLLQRLQNQQGFEILCKVLLPRTLSQDDQETKLKNVAVIAGIVGRPGHSGDLYANMINQITLVFQKALNGQLDEQFLVIAMGCLAKIYKLPLPDTRRIVRGYVFKELRVLSDPEDIIKGNIIFEHKDLVNMFRSLRAAFLGLPILTLPSKLLIPFLPLLLQMWNKLTHETDLRETITALVTRCLANRESTELGDLIDSLLLEEYHSDSLQLHPRIMIKQSSCHIGEPTQFTFYNPSDVLINLLKASNNNLLLYNIFLHLLGQLDQCLLDSSNQSSSFVEDLDEMSQLVGIVFKRRIAVIGSLSELINHKPFHGQFNENPGATIECLTNLMRRQISNHSTQNEPIMLVVLTIIRELLEKLKHNPGSFRHFLVALKEYRVLSNDLAIRNHIDGILQLIDDDVSEIGAPLPVESAFEAARSLCSSSEPHLRVYGLVQFTKLIRDGSDAEVVAKRHAILALAMDALRDDDSYVFLNCIRLLVRLVDVLEAEVLEAMVVEYRMEDGGDVDFRLKVGEVIVKVTEQLGPFAIRYKDILINCFLLGSVHRNDELRSSSLSNLGTICRLLSYQVTNFFEELMHITHTTIASDSYAPARRAAVMVFADLVQGFDKLQDFEEILLPVYRALKYALINETDTQTVVHANIGLARLAAKVKVFLTTGPEDRPIQVLGVKPEASESAKGRSILHIV